MLLQLLLESTSRNHTARFILLSIFVSGKVFFVSFAPVFMLVGNFSDSGGSVSVERVISRMRAV